MSGPFHPIGGVDYAPDAEAARWFETGDWLDRTVGEALAAAAARVPDRPAFVSDERAISFAELHADTDRLAAALLRDGLEPGDRAVFQMGTTVETAIALIAAYKAGIVPVCAVPQYREIEIGQLARLSGARGYFVQSDVGAFDLPAFARRMMGAHPGLTRLYVARGRACDLTRLVEGMGLDEARARLAEVRLGARDVLSFQLSGGTTGTPKIIPRFHGEYLGHSRGWMRRFRIGPDSRVIWSLPLIHNAGQLFALIPAALCGVTAVLMPRVDIRRMLELIERHRVTHALSIGPIAPQLLAYDHLADHDLSSLKLFSTMNRADVLEARLGRPCGNVYGITEGLLLAGSPNEPAALRWAGNGASGSPHDELRIVDPDTGADVEPGRTGELWFRGPSSLRAYYADPVSTAASVSDEGWFRTGDLMRSVDVDGRRCWLFEGRLRENINRGGEKIGCEEVETLVARHPAVNDAKLVAMPDPILGERACVFIIPKPGQRAPTVEELLAFLIEEGLAKFKCPERVETIADFPVTRVGKLDRTALQKLIR